MPTTVIVDLTASSNKFQDGGVPVQETAEPVKG